MYANHFSFLTMLQNAVEFSKWSNPRGNQCSGPQQQKLMTSIVDSETISGPSHFHCRCISQMIYLHPSLSIHCFPPPSSSSSSPADLLPESCLGTATNSNSLLGAPLMARTGLKNRTKSPRILMASPGYPLCRRRSRSREMIPQTLFDSARRPLTEAIQKERQRLQSPSSSPSSSAHQSSEILCTEPTHSWRGGHWSGGVYIHA